MMRAILILLLAASFAACKKKEVEELVVIRGNKAPPDSTTPNLVAENYVNKVYISVLGRKPTATELAEGIATLDPADFSETNRALFVDAVVDKPGYHRGLYTKARIDLLNDVDTNEYAENIAIFNFLLTDTAYMFAWDQLNIEIDRLERMQTVSTDLLSGTLDVRGMHQRCVDNYIYDQINMGTENFVVSLFQNFFNRYPTQQELEGASSMNDGLQGVLFLQDGYSKQELLEIFFDSDEYYEGQVRDLYVRYLFREPTSVEETDAAKAYETSGSYKELQKSILISGEYAGLK